MSVGDAQIVLSRQPRPRSIVTAFKGVCTISHSKPPPFRPYNHPHLSNHFVSLLIFPFTHRSALTCTSPTKPSTREPKSRWIAPLEVFPRALHLLPLQHRVLIGSPKTPYSRIPRGVMSIGEVQSHREQDRLTIIALERRHPSSIVCVLLPIPKLSVCESKVHFCMKLVSDRARIG